MAAQDSGVRPSLSFESTSTFFVSSSSTTAPSPRSAALVAWCVSLCIIFLVPVSGEIRVSSDGNAKTSYKTKSELCGQLGDPKADTAAVELHESLFYL